MHALPVEDPVRPRRSLDLGAPALLLSSAGHAAVLLPLFGLAWSSPGPPAEPPRTIEVILAWAAPAEAIPAPSPLAESPPTRTAATRTAPAHAPQAPPARSAAPARPETPPPTSTTDGPPAPAATPSVEPPPRPDPVIAPPPDPGAITAYSRDLLARLDRHKRYPALSQRRGEEGVVVLRLSVAADGRLISVEPTEEAPARLIEASLAAVREAAPFPPLPAGLGAGEAVFTLPISYRLR